MPTLTDWLDSIIKQAAELRSKLANAPEKDVVPTLEEIDANLSNLLSWAEDKWARD